MRYALLLFASCLSLSYSASAQGAFSPDPADSFPAEQGSYVLVDGRRGEGLIDYRLSLSPKIVILTPDGQKIKAGPEEVVSFRLRGRWFISTNESAETPSAANQDEFAGHFVQVVDTGRLILVRAYETINQPVGRVGAMGSYSTQILKTSLLIRRRDEQQWNEIPKPPLGGYSSKQFRKVMAHYFADRPDLLDSLEREALTFDKAMASVMAYNAGEKIFFLE